MAGPDTFTFTSPGLIKGTAATGNPLQTNEKALFLKLFSGETLTAYDRKVIFAALTKRVTINQGKSFQWPATGKVAAVRVTPGVEAIGQATFQNEVIIGLDPAVQVPLFFEHFFEKMSHFETRSEYAAQSGEALAVQEDSDIGKELLKASRAAALIGPQTSSFSTTINHDYGGSEIVSDKFKIVAGGVGAADVAEQAMAIYEALYLAAQTFAQKDVPLDQVYCALDVARYFNLVKAIQSNGFSLSNRDYFPSTADLNTGKLPKIANINILMHNQMPTTDSSGDGTDPHAVNASKCVGLIWRPDAVGTVVLQGMQVKVEEQVRAHGTYMTTFFMKGHGVLRPSSAISLNLSTLSN